MNGASIYLDHNSTTPIDPRVVEAMVEAWNGCGANPASQHSFGRKARRAVETARQEICMSLGAQPYGMEADRLIFTSGGTEANNLAVLGMAGPQGGRIIISAIEHPSVTAPAAFLARRGYDVQLAPVTSDGIMDLDSLSRLLNNHTHLVSVMQANNETGVFQPIREIAALCRPRSIRVHTDAVAAVAHCFGGFEELGVDAMTVAPHKFHGPVGIGALLLRHDVKLEPQLLGGFQQAALRPGTENVALAIGFSSALGLWEGNYAEWQESVPALRNGLERRLRDELPDIVIIGEKSPRVWNTSCVAFPGLDRQAIVMALDLAGVACSTGSACASGSSEPSPTLVAMGLPKTVIEGAIRLSLGAFTTADEVAEAARRIIKTIKHLRSTK